MTLVISVRIPDGVVLAVDSLSSVRGNLNLTMDAGFKCTHCGTQNELKQLQLPGLAIPLSTKSAAQKMVRFKVNYGVAFYGNSFVNQKSILAQIKSLEAHIEEPIANVDTIAEKILHHFEKQLREEMKDLSLLPEKAVPFGFQVVGFDANGQEKTWVVQMGRQPSKRSETRLGVTFSGDIALVQKLFKADPGLPTPQPNLATFSLQDAVDYAKFLIRFVADYQRFANMIPTVGGSIDVALVTSYAGFRWIERKKIFEILDAQ